MKYLTCKKQVILFLLVFSLQATDADLTSNLKYQIRAESLNPEISQLFHVDPVTGKLTVLKVLDYEALNDSQHMYTFTVEAVDKKGSMPPGLASVTVRVLVSLCLGHGFCVQA